MSRRIGIVINQNGALFEVETGHVKLRLGAASTADLKLRSDVLSGYTFARDHVFDVSVYYLTPGGTTAELLVMNDAIPRSARYGKNFSLAADERERILHVKERLWAYANFGPHEVITHKDTTLSDELTFIKAFIGYAGFQLLVPDTKIPTITYTREGGYWAAVEPYLTPFDATFNTEPSSNFLRIMDTTVFHEAMPFAGQISFENCNNLRVANVELAPDITQAKVLYTDFEGDEGRVPAVEAHRRNQRTTTEADGTKIHTWEKWAELHEDEDDPDLVTREVMIGEGQTHFYDDPSVGITPISEQETEYHYAHDWVRLERKTSTVKCRFPLPGVSGELYDEVERTVERHNYIEHPTLPGRYLLESTERITTGLYLYTWTEGETEEEITADIVATGLDIRTAARSGTIEQSATTNQRWGEGKIRTEKETYHRVPGARIVTINFLVRDDLRRRNIEQGHRTELGDLTISPTGYTKIEWVEGGALGVPPQRAVTVDATRVGLLQGRRIARRKITRSGKPAPTITLEPVRPDYSRFRLGYVTALTDAPYGLDGLYLITGVDFQTTAQYAGQTAPPVIQTLELRKLW